MNQRSAAPSYTTVGSPKFLLSHGFPKFPWLIRLSNVKAARRAPSDLRKIPTEVLTAWMKWVGPTSPTVSGGQPSPQLAKSSPANETEGEGAGAATPGGWRERSGPPWEYERGGASSRGRCLLCPGGGCGSAGNCLTSPRNWPARWSGTIVAAGPGPAAWAASLESFAAGPPGAATRTTPRRQPTQKIAPIVFLTGMGSISPFESGNGRAPLTLIRGQVQGHALPHLVPPYLFTARIQVSQLSFFGSSPKSVKGVVVHRFLMVGSLPGTFPSLLRLPSLAPLHSCHSLGGCPWPGLPVLLCPPDEAVLPFAASRRFRKQAMTPPIYRLIEGRISGGWTRVRESQRAGTTGDEPMAAPASPSRKSPMGPTSRANSRTTGNMWGWVRGGPL